MRRFVTAGFLALFVALFTGCDDQATDTPTEPQFGKKNKVTYECGSPYDLQYQLDALNEAAETIFMSRPTLKGLVSNIDNTARKVCTEVPNYQAALEQYYELEMLVNGQDLSKINGGEVARQAFLAMAYSFATGGAYNPGFSIPPEALGPDGGLFVVETPDEIPPEGLDLVAGSFEGAVRIYPETFLPEDFPVTIVEYRLPDDYTGGDGYSFGQYADDLVPEIWWFDASAQPAPDGPGFEAWVCVVDDPTDPYLWDRAQIVHATDDGGVELLDRLTENSPLGCTGAGPYLAAMGPSAPGWLQLASSVVRPVLKEIFGVKKLNAMYFAGKGLGGRGGSLSPFSAGDVLGQPEYNVSCDVSGGLGAVSLDGGQALCGAGASINIDNGFPSIATFVGSVSYPAGSEISVAATPGTGYEVTSLYGCDGGVTDPCIVTVDGDRSLTATFAIIPGDYALALSGGPAAGTILGYYTAPGAVPLGEPDFSCTVGPHTIPCASPELPAGTTVRLVAEPSVGSTFDGWSQDCEFATGADCWLAMYEGKAATASFVEDVVSIFYDLTINVVNDGGAGTVSDGTDSCDAASSPCVWSYAAETGFTLTGTATGPEDYRTSVIFFGDCAGNNGTGSGTCNLSMLGNRSTDVYFTILN